MSFKCHTNYFYCLMPEKLDAKMPTKQYVNAVWNNREKNVNLYIINAFYV